MKVYTKEHVISQCLKLHKEFGRRLDRMEFNRGNDLPSFPTVKKLFQINTIGELWEIVLEHED